TLELDHCDLDWEGALSLTSLQEICINLPAEGVEWHDLLNVFFHLPHLTTFSGNGFLDWQYTPRKTVPKRFGIPIPFEPPSLRSLALSEPKSQNISLLLHHLHFPSRKLEKLDVGLVYNDEMSDWKDVGDMEQLEREFKRLFEQVLGPGGTTTADNSYPAVTHYCMHGQTKASFWIEDPWDFD
ncbi:hypothetical protein BDN72DRAFT_864913, partial [Pluteus cervinus]